MKSLIFIFAVAQNFLLMQPIQRAVKTADFTKFSKVCTEMISINFEKPFLKSGYMKRERFVRFFSDIFKDNKVEKTEWSSLQNLVGIKRDDDAYAVQSLNLYMINSKSANKIVYKFIFFMVRKKGLKWKIYYLRGIKI